MPWRIDTLDPLPADLAAEISTQIDAYDRCWSRYRPDSLVARIARDAGTFRLPAEAGALLAWYAELFDATEGRLSPLAEEGMRAERFRDLIHWDGDGIHTVRPLTLDVAAAGKGQLVDLVARLLDDAKVGPWVIDASGDLRARAVTEWRVALAHPTNPRRAVGVAEPGDEALCASAVMRRDQRFHIVDGLTGLPVIDTVASWAIGPSALFADGAATALLVGVDASVLERHGIEHARLYADGRMEASAGFPGVLFAEGDPQ